MAPTYKLIRDKAPESANADTTILKGQRFIQAIQQQMREGVDSYSHAKTDRVAVEELVDLLELIHTALPLHNMTFEELDMVRRRKKSERGSFDSGKAIL